MATLEQIAALSGVSKSTVSRVVNGDEAVLPETRRRVLDVIREQGYRPNFAAKGLKSGRTNIIAAILPGATGNLGADPFMVSMMHGLARAADEADHVLVLSLDEPGFRHSAAELAAGGTVDGVIFSAATIGDPLLDPLVTTGVPVVTIGRVEPGRVPYADVDNAGASHRITSHLIELGRRNIAAVSGPLTAPVSIDRLDGYRSSLEAAGLPQRSELVFEGDFTEQSGRRAIEHLLPEAPDAVVAASDLMAFGVVKALRDRGLRVPEDVAVVGFDDVAGTDSFDPPLTTIRQSSDALARGAVGALIRLMSGEPPEDLNVEVPTELIVRVSCGASIDESPRPDLAPVVRQDPRGERGIQ